MSTKTKSRRPAPLPETQLPGEDWSKPPVTTQDCVDRIQELGVRVDGHVRFMCEIAKLGSTSVEAKRQAANDFYDRLQILERVLGRIREELRLG
jgi:hypothetical protein